MTGKNECRVWPGRWVGVSVVLMALQACQTPPPKPPEFGDDWKPVNTLAEEPMRIPLKEEQAMWTYQMLPTDATLRGMLERWATEHGGKLDWQYPTDLTLVSSLSSVKDNNIQKALNVVRRTYAEQRLRVQVLGNKNLLVTRLP